MQEKMILENAGQLAELFKNSDLYRDYCAYKEALKNEDTEISEKITAYKKSQYELETKRLKNGSVSFEDEKRLAHYYTELSLHKTAGPFLEKEYELLDLYRKVMDIISDACEID